MGRGIGRRPTNFDDLRLLGLRPPLRLGQFVIGGLPLLEALRLVNVDAVRAELAPADVAIDGGRDRFGSGRTGV